LLDVDARTFRGSQQSSKRAHQEAKMSLFFEHEHDVITKS